MKTYTLFILLTITSIVSTSCSDIFGGDDELISKRIEMSDVTKIQVKSIFHIELIQDDGEYILATASQNQLDKLSIHTENNSVFLKHNYNNFITKNTPIKVEVHLKDITNILVESPANIINKNVITTNKLDILVTEKSELVEMDLNLKCETLSFHVKGSVSGKYQFKGECPHANYTLNGTTNIMALDFKNQNITIAQNSIGEAHIFAEKKITATIYSSGDIYYKGNPDITIKRVQINNQSPTAQLIPLQNLVSN